MMMSRRLILNSYHGDMVTIKNVCLIRSNALTEANHMANEDENKVTTPNSAAPVHKKKLRKKVPVRHSYGANDLLDDYDSISYGDGHSGWNR